MIWLNAHIAYIRWAVIVGGLAATFWAGLHWANLECKSDKADLQAAQMKHQTQVIEKVQYVRVKTAAMPDGAAAIKLRDSWARD